MTRTLCHGTDVLNSNWQRNQVQWDDHRSNNTKSDVVNDDNTIPINSVSKHSLDVYISATWIFFLVYT